MHVHFSSFTPEAMRALWQESAAGFQQRREFLDKTRHDTAAMLADFRREHEEAEAQRRQRAGQDADRRRLFISELRSEVHVLQKRFELARREVAADFQQMAGERRATSEAFRSRPARRPAKFGGSKGTKSRPAYGEKPGHA